MGTTDRTIVIRADAGPARGTGHLMRSLALGQAWNRLGGQTLLVLGRQPTELIRRVESAGLKWLTIAGAGDRADALAVRHCAEQNRASWTILDGYSFGDSYQEMVASPGVGLLVMDDYGHARHTAADAVLNPNIHSLPVREPVSNSGPEWLLGTRYLLLRSEFTEPVHLRIRKPTVALARKIVVTLGGADPGNATLLVLSALHELRQRYLEIDVVIGAHYAFADQIDLYARQTGLRVRLHRNVERMSRLFQRADLAISAAGSTCYELAQCGIPCVALSIADNQRPVAEALDQRGILVDAGDAATLDASTLASRIGRVLRDARQRREMSLRGRQLVDGLGAERVARYLAARDFALVPATYADAELLRTLRNEPAVRAASFDGREVDPATHERWLRARLGDQNCRLWIARDPAGRPAGQLRLDRESEGMAAISIALDPACRGRGWSTLLIEKACRQVAREWGAGRVVARIKPENRVSQHTFRKAGFLPIEPTRVREQTAFQYVHAPDGWEGTRPLSSGSSQAA